VRVYLAGSSAELERVLAAAVVLRDLGHEITEPWWLRILEAKRRGWATDADVPPAFMRESAERNFAGIVTCDRFVGMCRAGGGLSSGHAYEVGVAVVTRGGPRTRLVGDPRGFVGMWVGDVRVVQTVEEALQP
jgi:hypothetical protein